MELQPVPPSVSTEFWTRLTKYNPIVLTAVTYTPRAHGLPSGNKAVSERDMIFSSDTLSHELLDTYQKQGQVFAIGSLVYLLGSDFDGRPFTQLRERTAMALDSEHVDLRHIEALGAEPYAIVMLDFDCSNSDHNKKQICGVLGSDFENTDWILFDTGGSFHIMFNQFVRPETLPKYYGIVINKFLRLADGEARHVVEKIGSILQDKYDDKVIIREICNFILSEFSHLDDPKDKLTYIIDMRWIAHSLLELLDYLENKSSSFAFLRTSPKTDGGSEPKTVIAHHNEIYTDISLRQKVQKSIRDNRQVDHFYK